ncbi:MAG: TIGR03943 family protein [Bellilinea sp.]|nr:TIGR03943 family protein [Bellilinea sp.]
MGEVSMTRRAGRSFQALILALMGLYLLSRIWNGNILLYINQRFVVLVFLAGLSLVVLAQFLYAERLKENHNQEVLADNWKMNLWWLTIPILIGFLIPARPLSPSAVVNRGVSMDAPLSARIEDTASLLSLSPSERTVLDWIRLFSYSEDVQQFVGQPVDVTGFVFSDGRLSDSQFMVGRFTITCCVADATALGIIVEYSGLAAPREHSWVRVQGTIDLLERDGRLFPVILAKSVEAVPQPEQPYLFP